MADETGLKIIKGSDKEFIVKVTVSDGCNTDPFDLTGAAEIKAKFLKSDDTILEKLMTLGAITIINAALGKLKVSLSDSDTNLLKVGEDQCFQIEITVGSTTSIIQFREILTVFDSVFADC